MKARRKTKIMKVNVIGAGLAGTEAAYQLAKRGIDVVLHEMKPEKFSPAHSNPNMAEIVCSNSLKSIEPSTASGTLKAELEILGSIDLKIAKQVSVPAGSALAVDREKFSEMVTSKIKSMPNINVVSGEVKEIDLTVPTIIATGPLTSESLSCCIKNLLGDENLFFYDASAPIIDADSIDYSKTFNADRYGKGESDYINCPMNKEEYYNFVQELVNAKRVELKSFEKTEIFQGCMPIEVMASSGIDSLRFGPLRPVGFVDENGKRPFAVVQLRKENTESELYNIVGFQTNLTFGEQNRIFKMIPALANAEFVKYGVMHRNTYLNSPKHLNSDFSLKTNPQIYFAGQLAGVEGYVESIASGLVAGISLANKLLGKNAFKFTNKTIIGALCNYISTENVNFQPMNANFGILEPLENAPRDKSLRKLAYFDRAVKETKQLKEIID